MIVALRVKLLPVIMASPIECWSESQLLQPCVLVMHLRREQLQFLRPCHHVRYLEGVPCCDLAQPQPLWPFWE